MPCPPTSESSCHHNETATVRTPPVNKPQPVSGPFWSRFFLKHHRKTPGAGRGHKKGGGVHAGWPAFQSAHLRRHCDVRPIPGRGRDQRATDSMAWALAARDKQGVFRRISGGRSALWHQHRETEDRKRTQNQRRCHRNLISSAVTRSHNQIPKLTAISSASRFLRHGRRALPCKCALSIYWVTVSRSSTPPVGGSRTTFWRILVSPRLTSETRMIKLYC